MPTDPSSGQVPLPGAGEPEQALHLLGDVTGAGLADLDRRLQQHVDDGGGVVEVSEVTFLPAAAAGLLHSHVLAAALRQVELHIVARPPCIAGRVLTVLAVPHRAR